MVQEKEEQREWRLSRAEADCRWVPDSQVFGRHISSKVDQKQETSRFDPKFRVPAKEFQAEDVLTQDKAPMEPTNRAAKGLKRSMLRIFRRQKSADTSTPSSVQHPTENVERKDSTLPFDQSYMANKKLPMLMRQSSPPSDGTDISQGRYSEVQTLDGKKRGEMPYMRQRPLSGRYPRIYPSNIELELSFQRQKHNPVQEFRSQTEPICRYIEREPSPPGLPQGNIRAYPIRSQIDPENIVFPALLSREFDEANNQHTSPLPLKSTSRFPPNIRKVFDKDTLHHAASPPKYIASLGPAKHTND